MKRLRYPLIATIVLAGSSLAVWAFAGNYLQRIKLVPVSEQAAKASITVDAGLLKELAGVYQKMNGDTWGMEGSLSLLDREDSTAAMEGVPFSYQQSSNRMYYRLGETEMVNLEDCYIVMQHDASKILVSDPRPLIRASHIPLETLMKMVQDEEYSVTRRTAGTDATITLSRPNHISCKEYAITFDTATLELRGIYSRMTNLQAPLDSAMDKVMDVRVTHWVQTPQKKWFDKHHYILGGNGNYSPATAYAAYQLIRL